MTGDACGPALLCSLTTPKDGIFRLDGSASGLELLALSKKAPKEDCGFARMARETLMRHQGLFEGYGLYLALLLRWDDHRISAYKSRKFLEKLEADHSVLVRRVAPDPSRRKIAFRLILRLEPERLDDVLLIHSRHVILARDEGFIFGEDDGLWEPLCAQTSRRAAPRFNEALFRRTLGHDLILLEDYSEMERDLFGVLFISTRPVIARLFEGLRQAGCA